MNSSFHKYQLHERVLEALLPLRFITPTSVQEKVIPFYLGHENLIVEAPTGTGKTAAYGFPIISMIDLLKRKTQAVILLPTRELALQVSSALLSYYSGKELKVGKVIGGVPIEESYREIKSSPHILVIVPGRLRDVLSQYELPFIWRDVKHLVIDEGDKMMEMGFLREVDSIRKEIRNNVQISCFSATISADAEKMMRERIERARVVRLAPQEVLRHITFHLIEVTQGQREPYLAGLLKQQKIRKALIFCNKREDIHALLGYLRSAGFSADAYHGSQEQTERENILRRFREGHIHYLVASDLAARGLDILDLPCVINFTIPGEFDYYLHRCGRTGRAGNKGKVYNLVTGGIESIELQRHHQDINVALKPLEIIPLEKKEVVSAETRRVKCHISRGKTDNLRPADVVGFIVNNAWIDAEDIGTITVYESYTTVDLPQHALDVLLASETELRIKNKSVKVRKYSVEEQEIKAKSVKKLLQVRVKPAVVENFEEKPEKPEKAPSKQKSTDAPKTEKPKAKGKGNTALTIKPPRKGRKPLMGKKKASTAGGAKPVRKSGTKPKKQ